MPIAVDSPDGMNPTGYHALILAGKDSPVKTIQDVRGQDFTFVDPGSTSGYLFPSVMLIVEPLMTIVEAVPVAPNVRFAVT